MASLTDEHFKQLVEYPSPSPLTLFHYHASGVLQEIVELQLTQKHPDINSAEIYTSKAAIQNRWNI